MVELGCEPLAATVLGDDRAVVIRPLGEDDHAARNLGVNKVQTSSRHIRHIFRLCLAV